jgi:hypothetical protein
MIRSDQRCENVTVHSHTPTLHPLHLRRSRRWNRRADECATGAREERHGGGTSDQRGTVGWDGRQRLCQRLCERPERSLLGERDRQWVGRHNRNQARGLLKDGLDSAEVGQPVDVADAGVIERHETSIGVGRLVDRQIGIVDHGCDRVSRVPVSVTFIRRGVPESTLEETL